MSKMYKCLGECLCAKCKNNEVNCSECKYSIKKTKKCVTGGIKNCEYYEGSK